MERAVGQSYLGFSAPMVSSAEEADVWSEIGRRRVRG